jgi:hypothetical protein
MRVILGSTMRAHWQHRSDIRQHQRAALLDVYRRLLPESFTPATVPPG